MVSFRCVSWTGGDDGIRTHDPLLAGQVLSQLSYTPVVSIPHLILYMSKVDAPSKLNNNNSKSLLLVCTDLYQYDDSP